MLGRRWGHQGKCQFPGDLRGMKTLTGLNSKWRIQRIKKEAWTMKLFMKLTRVISSHLPRGSWGHWTVAKKGLTVFSLKRLLVHWRLFLVHHLYIGRSCTEDETRPSQRKTIPEVSPLYQIIPAIFSILVPCFGTLDRGARCQKEEEFDVSQGTLCPQLSLVKKRFRENYVSFPFGLCQDAPEELEKLNIKLEKITMLEYTGMSMW